MRSHYSAGTPTWSSLEAALLLELSASQLMKNLRLQKVGYDFPYFEVPKTFHHPGIRLKFFGEAKVRWSERQNKTPGSNKEKRTVHYKNEERLKIL